MNVDEVPTSLTEAMVTPRLVESWAVLPWSAEVDVWAESSDGTMMVTWRMVLPAVTWMVMSLTFTPSRLARLARNCA
jgi:hypothetical protein